MTTPNNGGAAFPVADNMGPHGMTKREAFAMAALQGILGNAYWNENGPYTPTDVAQAAREYADALLAELNGAES